MPEHTNIKIESPGVNVAVVKKDYDGWKFLILKRAEGESYGGYWGFMTGGKKGSESVAQVVVRELKEETGLDPDSIWASEYLVQFYEPEFDAIWILPLIVAVVPEDAEVNLSPENSEYRWLPAGKARHLVSWNNLVHAIDNIANELEIFPARNWVQITP
ncbi:MAG: NUDIX domain-containing protein [Candidatus Zixiibacteriota bacterium]|nr:MAG: NUDIX domain-containing protein [candidate division Zixibacteria bacterium]